MENNSTHGIKPERLFNLLSIGTDRELFCNELMASDEDIKDYFQSFLRRKVPKESSIVDMLLIYLRESKAFAKRVVDCSLEEILINPETGLDLLRTIKDFSKKIYLSAISKGENSIAVAIYYSAIASGLIYHDAKISEHNYQTLKDAFSNLIHQPWMIPEIKQLLSQAYEICRNEHITQ